MSPTTNPSVANEGSGQGGQASADLRRIKSGLSCAECRRSKLKCDRSFPCQSCIRRGCAAICPDGTLMATKGNKVLMEQVKTMSTRIKQLEEALAKTQDGSRSHPLLDIDNSTGSDATATSDLDESLADELDDISDTIGSLSVAEDGKTIYHGETANPEYIQNLMPASDSRALSNPKFLGLPSDILDLVNAYPFGLREHSMTTEAFRPFVPPRARTDMVANLFYANAAWLYDPIPRDEFEKIICEPVYQAVNGYGSFQAIPAHSLAIFFMILATGLLFNTGQSAPILVEQYHALACAAFSLDSITRGASTSTVQALLLMIHFSYWTDRNGIELRWLYNGLCVRIAQMIGLQRDSAGWHLDKDEVQRRRRTFWEFYDFDAWSSVITGRPPALNIAQSDCKFPEDISPHVNSHGEREPGWHMWKFQYLATCLAPSIHRTFSVRPLTYASLLELDKRIRAFPTPEYLRSDPENGQGWNSDPGKAMMQHCAVSLRHSNLLYIHRAYFAHAIRSSGDPVQHRFGRSVLAAYESVLALMKSLKGLSAAHPALTSRVWLFWSAMYSACVVLGAIVVESPGCKLARDALKELDIAVAIFEEGSTGCRPASTLRMLLTFQARARDAFNGYRPETSPSAGAHQTTPPFDSNNTPSPPSGITPSRPSVKSSPHHRGSHSPSEPFAFNTLSDSWAQQPPAAPRPYYSPPPPHPPPSDAPPADYPQMPAQDYNWMVGVEPSPLSASTSAPAGDFAAGSYPQSDMRMHLDDFQARSGGLDLLLEASAAGYSGYGQGLQQVQPPISGQPPSAQPGHGYRPGAVQGPGWSANIGHQEDIWQDLMQHLGMRSGSS